MHETGHLKSKDSISKSIRFLGPTLLKSQNWKKAYQTACAIQGQIDICVVGTDAYENTNSQISKNFLEKGAPVGNVKDC